MADKSFFQDIEQFDIAEIRAECKEWNIELNADKNLRDILAAEFPENGKIIVYTPYDLKLGYWKAQKGCFVYGEEENFESAIEIRIFNNEKELWVKRSNMNNWRLRLICDGETAGKSLAYEDIASPFIGQRYGEQTGEGFVLVGDEGRKTEHYLPAEEKSKRYELTVRTYIGKNELTGQAGFAFYRFKNIADLKDGEV